MCTNFDDFWKRAVPFLNKKITEARDAGGKLEMGNWAVAGRIRRKTIPITKASEAGITCLTKKGKEISASRKDLKYTCAIWDDYLNETVSREQITKATRRSTYTICTIRYLLVHRITCDRPN